MADKTMQELCEAALRKLRVVDPSETPNSQELDNAFEETKRMLLAWAAKGLYVYVSTEDTHTLTVGTTSYSIGSGETIDSDRPVSLQDSCFVRANGSDYPLSIIGEGRYNRLQDKDSGNDYPEFIYYKPTYPNGTIYLWPPGGGELHLWSLKELAEPATVAADMVAPGQYQDAIVWNLASRLSPEFVGDPTPYMMAMASYTREAIINRNAANNLDEMDLGINGLGVGTSRHNIDRG